MRLNNFGLLLLGILIMVGAVSCGSTPPAEEETPAPAAQTAPPPGVDKTAVDDLDAAIARANAARKLVVDFNGPELLPADWQSANSLYSQAEQQRSNSTTESIRESAARYIRAAEAMEALAAATLVRNYEIKARELADARFEAVRARAEDVVPSALYGADDAAAEADRKFKAQDYYGARDSAVTAQLMYDLLKDGMDSWAIRDEVISLGGWALIPDLIEEADAVGFDALNEYEAGKFDAARDTAGRANTMYSLLKSGMLAYKVREEVFGMGFERYDAAHLAGADEALDYAAGDYTRKNFPAAREEVDQAMLFYGLALKTGWETYSEDMAARATRDRQIALDLKANVAVRDEFNTAQDLYNRAGAARREQRHSDAARLYSESASMFEVINEVAREKRRIAEEALIMANQRMSESDETARNAERILEGGTR